MGHNNLHNSKKPLNSLRSSTVYFAQIMKFFLLILILMDYVIEHELRSIYYVQNHNIGQ